MPNFHGRSIGPDRYPLLERLIADGQTSAQIAQHLAVGAETVRKFARKRGLTIRRVDQSMENHPAWTGGTTLDRAGYSLQRVEAAGEFGYLIRALRHGDARGYAPVHRVRMHRKIGRRLDPAEVVHHIDGDIRNNDPSNLDVYPTNADHLRDTLAGRVPDWTPDGLGRIAAGVRQARIVNTKHRP